MQLKTGSWEESSYYINVQKTLDTAWYINEAFTDENEIKMTKL